MLKKLFAKKTSVEVEMQPATPPADVLPDNAFQMALEFHQQGNFARADALYRQILQHQPHHPDALHFLGVSAHQQGQHQTAIELMQQAIAICPTAFPFYCNLGLAFHAAGQLAQAEHSYRHALFLQPEFVEARCNLGNLFAAQKKVAAALESYRYALILQPENALVRNQLQNLLTMNPGFSLEQTENSASFTEAKAHYELGVLSHVQWKLPQAIESYKKALAFKLDYIEAYNNLGLAYQDQYQMDEAMRCFQCVISLKPDFAPAYHNLGYVWFLLGDQAKAIENYQKALSFQPDYGEAINMLFYTQLHCCDWSAYDESRQKIAQAIATAQPGYKPFPFLALSESAAAQQQCARTYANYKYPLPISTLTPKQGYSHDKIRIAYVSDDFREHPVSYLLADLLEQHDKSRFEIIGISLSPEDKTATGQRIKNAFQQFIDVSQMDNLQAAQLIRELEIDIAVDLMGFTSYSRPGIFAYHPASVQVNYLGFSATTGVDYLDYILADKTVIPLEQQRYYSEKVAYLPDSYLPNDSKRAIPENLPTRSQAGLPEQGFVFCCFNNSYKLSPDVFAIWMRLLKRVENSVLWLSSSNALAVENLRKQATAHGVSAERLIFATKLPNIEDHFARQQLADLFLDTLPYNAHTTTSDALSVGLPVLTCLGNTFAGRVAGSLLNAVGLPELFTCNLVEYENLAIKLATSPGLLAEIRAKLQKNRHSYPLFDTDRLRRHIEAAYITMWEKHQRGELPSGFSVSPIESNHV